MSDSEDFWLTWEGIQERIDLLAEDFTWRSYNNALQIYGERNDAYGVEIIGPIDANTCKICDPLVGRIYRLGQFIPGLPKHPHCRHFFRLISKEEYNP